MTYLSTEPTVALARARLHDLHREAARLRRLAEVRPGRADTPARARLGGWNAPFRLLRGDRALTPTSPAAA